MPLLRPAFFGFPCLVAVLALPACGGGGDSNGPADAGELEPVTCPREPSVCGNSVVEPGESCEPPGTATCDADCQRIPAVAPDPACDMTGHWAVEKVTVSAALGIQATTYNHMYYHVVQDGTGFEIVDSLDCGFFVQAPLVNVTLSGQTRDALRCITNSTGRRGTYVVNDGDCELSFDTAYSVRGLSPPEYWLDDDWAPVTMEPSEPSLARPESPSCTCTTERCDCDDTGRYDPVSGTPGWEDWDRDGMPGITLLPGTSKWLVHLGDWDRFQGTTNQGTAEDPLEELQIGVEWWNHQVVIATTVGAIVADEAPDTTADHYITLKRIAAPDRNAGIDADANHPDRTVCQAVAAAFQ
jgi:hypothetical protein